ncbi:hypothetical protein CS022_02155 [Veronia nyctiphanis]|uniref:ParD-like antitoxin of type II toxin-antitoxin system n=1 Tax=Veronia nyctiphanis TaxID=1278244 RepID=A0A4Q0YZ77_9GAMM|nr:ParD-like family protein [Veronia nyctiphanis]RXJ74431.1 hypothetical protein CS022_02155 [Veronia nyctiphanis]
MGIVKISEDLHDEIRKASGVMSRSINSQAEFWIKIGMQAEMNPQCSFNELVATMLAKANISADNLSVEESER